MSQSSVPVSAVNCVAIISLIHNFSAKAAMILESEMMECMECKNYQRAEEIHTEVQQLWIDHLDKDTAIQAYVKRKLLLNNMI